MEKFVPLFYLNLFGYKFGVTSSLLIQWVIIVILTILAIVFTRDLKKIPNKKQNVVEILVETFNKLVKENMGEGYAAYVPYIGTLAMFLLLMNLAGLVGLKPPTLDLSVVAGLALITFVLVQANGIIKIGLGHYFSAYFQPYAAMLPLNLIERFMLPVSLTLRLFGNMTAAVVIMDMVYNALGNIAWVAQLGIPVPLHAYFDVFDGTIQMVIFMMLTMINIKITAEH
ncbi:MULTISPECIES: F0F1 ATP synthase subunit A [Clostridium]|uniref:ATP synthase subunit a n=1 Tax=Clostridium ljungdahlii TaxID=1538 RepID=A0A162LA82_9CLOT|nr:MULTISPECIES: F0F1 ATP synthase subunit A [Clostridium]OAA86708.1 ATP synthase subunit a [Clostridium ljungdahlii]QXE19477.1 F0F1 ATP synthase subunit A [Clostridium sp. 001]